MTEYFVHPSQMGDQPSSIEAEHAGPPESDPSNTGRLVVDVRLVINADSPTDPTTTEQLIPVVVDLTTGTARASTDRDLAELPVTAAEIRDASRTAG